MTPLEILKQGIIAAKQGNKTKAKEYLRQVIAQDRHNEQAWVWLSSVVDSPKDKKFCLEQVLTINPDNQLAKRGLTRLISQQNSSTPPNSLANRKSVNKETQQRQTTTSIDQLSKKNTFPGSQPTNNDHQFCHNCGKPTLQSDRFCSSCGQDLMPVPDKSALVLPPTDQQSTPSSDVYQFARPVETEPSMPPTEYQPPPPPSDYQFLPLTTESVQSPTLSFVPPSSSVPVYAPPYHRRICKSTLPTLRS